MKLHAQGKTEQAQKDLARLAEIKARREAAQAKRKAEADGALLLHISHPCLNVSISQSSGNRSKEDGWQALKLS